LKKELFIERLLLLLALSSIGSLLMITVFIFWEGVPLIAHTGLKNFLFSSHWRPPAVISASWP
jgi:phosphate transport system permease protein